MCEAEITGVEVVYAASPSLMGAYRVTARFAGRGEATFVQAMVDPPKVGEVWSLEEPRLDEMIRWIAPPSASTPPTLPMLTAASTHAGRSSWRPSAS
jgi:hypothetical protein